LANAQERDRVEEFLWAMQLLQVDFPGFFSAWSTTDGSYQSWGFHLDRGVTKSFDHMKEIMGTCPMLALPNFTLPFVLERDTSSEGIRVFLM
jgi:hypothetical protein